MTFEVRNIDIDSALKIINTELVDGSFSGELVDVYNADENVVVAVYEKYFYRVKNYLTATVVLTNTSFGVKVYVKSSGGSETLLNFDWGASDKFEETVEKSLEEYIV